MQISRCSLPLILAGALFGPANWGCSKQSANQAKPIDVPATLPAGSLCLGKPLYDRSFATLSVSEKSFLMDSVSMIVKRILAAVGLKPDYKLIRYEDKEPYALASCERAKLTNCPKEVQELFAQEKKLPVPENSTGVAVHFQDFEDHHVIAISDRVFDNSFHFTGNSVANLLVSELHEALHSVFLLQLAKLWRPDLVNAAIAETHGTESQGLVRLNEAFVTISTYYLLDGLDPSLSGIFTREEYEHFCLKALFEHAPAPAEMANITPWDESVHAEIARFVIEYRATSPTEKKLFNLLISQVFDPKTAEEIFHYAGMITDKRFDF